MLNVSFTNSFTQSLSPQKCSSNRFKLSNPINKNMLIKGGVFLLVVDLHDMTKVVGGRCNCPNHTRVRAFDSFDLEVYFTYP